MQFIHTATPRDKFDSRGGREGSEMKLVINESLTCGDKMQNRGCDERTTCVYWERAKLGGADDADFTLLYCQLPPKIQ